MRPPTSRARSACRRSKRSAQRLAESDRPCRRPPPRASRDASGSARATHASISSGMRMSRSVWPVGAVSKITRSKPGPRRRMSAPIRSNSATSSAPGMLAARSICLMASFRIECAEQLPDALLDLATYRADSVAASISEAPPSPPCSSHWLGPDWPLEDVGGGVRRIGGDEQHAPADPARPQRHRGRTGGLAHAALAAEEQHLRSSSPFHAAARQAAERRAVHAHAPVPQVELIEQVRVDLEQVERRRIGQAHDFHVAEQQEVARSARRPAASSPARSARRPRLGGCPAGSAPATSRHGTGQPACPR